MIDLDAIFGPDALAVVPAEPKPDYSAWILRRDRYGRLGCEAPGLTEAQRWWDTCEEVLPDPCPRCGSLEKWWDLLGGGHCQRCEMFVMEHSRSLANRAARLRRQSMAA